MKKILEVKKITKEYKIYKNNFSRFREALFGSHANEKFIANKDITFDLLQGETLGIIGMNGAGKSTLLKIIAGVICPTSGEVIRYGRVTALLELGTGFNLELTGKENIFLNGSLIGLEKDEITKKEKQIIDFSELGPYINEPLKTYSSGMVMRLAFSIALFSEPEILIVDEALSVGDAHFSQKCTTALRERKKQKMSIIYVSHDLNSLKVLCDRLLMLQSGMIASMGASARVINDYYRLISGLDDCEDKISVHQENNYSFGNFEIEINDVQIKGLDSNLDIIASGETAVIDVFMDSKIETEDVTVGISIRDKFGQDIFGTNTFYQKFPITISQGRWKCSFKMPLNIGVGKYSLSVSVHKGEYHTEYCYCWLDFAKEFEVVGVKGNIFIGLCQLYPEINFAKAEALK